MAAPRKELAEAVIHLLESGRGRKQTVEAVASYLVANRRTKELNALLRDLEELRFKRENTLEVTASVAYPLSAEAKKRIEQLFSDSKVTIHEDINKEMLGGVKVRALDKVADFSVQTRLRKLRAGRS